MTGILLIALSAFFGEVGTSIGKWEIAHRKESLYGMGFLTAWWSVVFLLITGLLMRHEFVFSLASLPTFCLRAVLEVTLLFVSLNAIMQADRSTFTFLRILTIPLLLAADVALGYAVSLPQMLGIGSIAIAFILLYLNHGLSARGKLLSLLAAVLAVATLSLYKYDISHFNSVEAEQSAIYFILVLTLFIAAKVRTGENVLGYLARPVFLGQSLAAGASSLLASFAYLFSAASVVTAASRSFEMLAAIASGRLVFHEKNPLLKAAAFVFIAAGIVLLTR